MERGTYAATSSGFVQLRRLEVVNNNLANVNTPGFKRQFLIRETQEFEDTLARLVEHEDPFARGDHERTKGTIHVRTVTDFAPGPIKNTGNDLDAALRNPNQFFVINTPTGIQYSRAGNFTLNEEGQLVNHEGFLVQGDGGAITANGAGMKIAPGGVVSSNGEEVGRLQVVEIADPSVLERTAGTRFILPVGNPDPQVVESPALETQALEMSNVTAVSSVIEMISANRGFEMYTKMARTIDDMNQTAVQRLGRRG